MPFCSKCGKEIQKDWAVCPFCGAPNLASDKKETKKSENRISTNSANTQLTSSGDYGIKDFENILPGTIIDGKYKVEEKLGKGGFGTVYKAWYENLDEYRAIKVISTEYYDDKEVIADLKSEAKKLNKVKDEHVVYFYDVHLDGDFKYIDIEYVDGGDLVDLKLSYPEKKVPEEKVLDIAKQFTMGMIKIHAQHIIHKDIKPQNVMLTKDGIVKIMDFGIAEQFRSSRSRLKHASRAGTPVYMSPEHLIGEDVGKEADIWSFGVMMYELLTGKLLYNGQTSNEILMQIERKTLKPIPKISEKTNQFLKKCLQYKFEDRFRSFWEVKKFLERDFEAEKKEQERKEKLQREETEKRARLLHEKREKEQKEKLEREKKERWEKYIREQEIQKKQKKEISNRKEIESPEKKVEEKQKTIKEKNKPKKGLIWFFIIILIISLIVIANNISKQKKQKKIERLYNSKNITMADIDGNVYKTVKIGNQIWMAENLKVTHYRNGDAIPNVTDDKKWSKLSTGAYCVYDNKSSNADTYGNLYNWFAVSDPRGLAPEGWHVPSDEEIKILEKYLGMWEDELDVTDFRGTNEGSQLAGRSDLWSKDSLVTNIDFDKSGFKFIPAGNCNGKDGKFKYMHYFSYLWSSKENSSKTAITRALSYTNSKIYRNFGYKRNGFSIRCIKDE